jgi:hypothetical protein
MLGSWQGTTWWGSWSTLIVLGNVGAGGSLLSVRHIVRQGERPGSLPGGRLREAG